ncbi:MAG: LysR family transcriptional regulator [Proteobacteria bacterium]|nr:LysR family transcriptional regulator [Pseudomonadota bacterium]
MNLWQLKIFCKTVELKSFSKAGEYVHLTQPTISSHIKDLEDHFGCRLINRMGKEVSPTKAGELLYGYAVRLTALLDEAESAMNEFQGKIKGRLVMGGSTIPGGYILPDVIGSFTKVYPDVRILLSVADTEEIITRILSGELEFGIVGAKISDKSISQEKLMEEGMHLIVKKDHKWAEKKSVSLKMLTKEPFILREPGSGTLKTLDERITSAGFSIYNFNIIAEMGSTAAVCQGIKSGVGISILSPVAVKEELLNGSLKSLRIEDVNLKRIFYLSRHKHKSLSPLSNAFIKHLKRELVQHD